jgi:hypothetical protein
MSTELQSNTTLACKDVSLGKAMEVANTDLNDSACVRYIKSDNEDDDLEKYAYHFSSDKTKTEKKPKMPLPQVAQAAVSFRRLIHAVLASSQFQLAVLRSDHTLACSMFSEPR